MTAAEILAEAERAMEQRGWCQGSMANRHGNVCLMGALMAAAPADWYNDSRVWTAAVVQVQEVCRENYGTPSVMMINDNIVTSKEEALTILGKARVRAEEEI